MKHPNIAKSMLCGIALALTASFPAHALELTAGHVNPPGEPCYEAFTLLQKKLAAGTTGLTLKIFPHSQIGDEKDAIEQVKMGALTMTCVASANLSAFAPIVGVFDINKVGSQAWTVGTKVYWDDTNKRCTTVATDNTLIGVAVEAVASGAGDTIGRVRLNATF